MSILKIEPQIVDNVANFQFGNVFSTGYFYANNSPFPAGFAYTASTTAPTNPGVKDQWYNTTTNVLYEYMNDGTSSYWVDIQTPVITSAIQTNTTYVNRAYTANGTGTTYTVTSGCSVNNVLVFLNGVCQMPTTDYTITGTTLTLDAAPAAGTSIQIRELPR